MVLVTDDLSSNSLGRTFCLWMLAARAGYDVTVISERGEAVWAPLAGSDFSAVCHRMDFAGPTPPWEPWEPAIVVCVKALPNSLGRILPWVGMSTVPILLDIDDPDLEGMLSIGRPIKHFAKRVLRPRFMREIEGLRKIARSMPTMVSNPVLQAYYGGVVVPHVRADPGTGIAMRTGGPVIAFVGTNREHKGVDVLRRAVELAQEDGYQLVLTDEPPADAAAWESWIGRTSLEEGLRVVGNADVVVIPSLSTPMSRGQLPVKLVDGMLSGRAVLVSDLDVLRWGVGSGGRSFKTGSAESLRDILHEIASPEVRAEMGRVARAEALARFTVDAVLPDFKRACSAAMRPQWGAR